DAGPPASLQLLAVRQRTNFLRDRTEGVSRWDSRRGGRVRTVESRDRLGSRVRSYARRVPPRAGLQRLRSSRTDRRLRIRSQCVVERARVLVVYSHVRHETALGVAGDGLLSWGCGPA